jgi:hypothetical protein
MVESLRAFNLTTIEKALYQTYRRVCTGKGKSIKHNFYSENVDWNQDMYGPHDFVHLWPNHTLIVSSFGIFLGEPRPVLVTFFANFMTATSQG